MTSTSASNTSSSTTSVISQTILGNNFNVLPNKSSLFNTNLSSSSLQISTNTTSQTSSSTSLSSYNSNNSIIQQQQMNKPVPNYGKPNLAPKPPGMQSLQLSLALPSQPATGRNSNGRPTVARHHSMKTPRYNAFLLNRVFFFLL